MSTNGGQGDCGQSERVSLYAVGALPAGERADLEAHLRGCGACRRELASLRPVMDALAAWPTDVLRPDPALQSRLAQRLAESTGREPQPVPASRWKEPEWDEVANGIFCKVLALDTERRRVSLLVRLLPDVEYPPHTHAGIEELHLLEGELWIDGRKLVPGDYNRAAAPTGDKRVWSETGCTCVLITSTHDILT